MTGTIEDLDQQEGKLSLETEEGETLSLHFPPSALKDYKEGDRVSVQLGIAKQTGAASATGSTSTSGMGSSRSSRATDSTGAMGEDR